MARVSSTASLGMRIGLGSKKGYHSHDAASPHHSFTIERELSEELSDEQLTARAVELHDICEKLVKDEMNKELKEIKELPTS